MNSLLRCSLLLALTASGAVAPPTITSHPYNNTAVSGQTVGFGVMATGTGTLRFQWYRNNELVAGATNDRFYHLSATVSDAGTVYTVVVTDDTGSTTSAPATLAISAYTAREEWPVPDAATARYHLDAVNGSDTTGDGSASKPYKTIPKVVGLLRGGETVVFHNGTYGDLGLDYINDDIAAPFTDWVTFMAAPGAAPVVNRIFVRGGWHPNRVDANSRFDSRTRFVGLDVADGVIFTEANYVRMERCRIRRLGPCTGSIENMGKTAVGVRCVRSITIQDCEITDAAYGIGSRGNDLVYRRNHIHDLSNDALRLTGSDTVLIERNEIHRIDDGVDDSVPWSAHCDGLQVYQEGWGAPTDQNSNLTLRGNRFYHIESMALMLQDDTENGQIDRNWVMENNVFGPSGGFMIHGKFACDGFIFRHNSVVEPADNTFTSRYRTVAFVCNNYDTALPAYFDSRNVEIYNNIFCGLGCGHNWIQPSNTTRFDHNLFYHDPVGVLHGTSPVESPVNPFAHPDLFDGALGAASAAINAGSPAGPVGTDLRGAARHARPDIGAFELAAPDPYDTWAGAAGLTGEAAAPLADPDGDGMCNAVEYALATAPLLPTPAAQCPTLGRDTVTGAITLTHRRHTVPGLAITYQTSTDLVEWTTATPAVAVENADPDGDGRVELVRASLTSAPDEPRRFFRIGATVPRIFP